MTKHEKLNLILIPATGLAVAYVRNALQYGRYFWQSWLEFMGFWALHTMALILFIVLGYAAASAIDANLGKHEISAGDSFTYFSVFTLIVSVFVFFSFHFSKG